MSLFLIIPTEGLGSSEHLERFWFNGYLNTHLGLKIEPMSRMLLTWSVSFNFLTIFLFFPLFFQALLVTENTPHRVLGRRWGLLTRSASPLLVFNRRNYCYSIIFILIFLSWIDFLSCIDCWMWSLYSLDFQLGSRWTRAFLEFAFCFSPLNL